MNIIKNIEIIGDSILRGVVFDEISCKYKLLKESAANLFGAANSMDINNHSKFGCTTKKALQNLPAILGKENSAPFVLVELGGNDCDFNWREVCLNPLKEHLPNVSFADFKANIANIIEQIITAGKRPVVMTLPPIDSDRYFDFITGGCMEKAKNLLLFLGDKNRIYRHQELYAGALEKMAVKYNLFTINVREALLKIPKYSDYLCLDGIHLNSLGQDLIKQVCDKTYQDYLATQ